MESQFTPTRSQARLFESFGKFLETPSADILIVNGYAGCGKTTGISKIIRFLPNTGYRSVLLAPTGRSAKVFSSYSGRKAFTIHKHIYRLNAGRSFVLVKNRAEDTIFFVDEASLVGSDGERSLLDDLVTFVREGNGCKLVLIGDNAQLPPVGMNESPALDEEYMSATYGRVAPSVQMTEVVRQSEDSGILTEATRVREAIFDWDFDDIQGLCASLGGYPDVKRIDGSELIDCLSQAYAKYGEEETIVLAYSNKRALRYNLGIRSMVKYYEERLCRGEAVMVVKNNYCFVPEEEKALSFIANGDIAYLGRVRHFENRYGLEFADATLTFLDYDDVELRDVKVCLDALLAPTPALTAEQSNALYEGVLADYSHITNKKDLRDAMQKDPYLNALQIKYAAAVTTHKSQGGGWDCVFIDYASFAFEDPTFDALKWLYTALTRAKKQVYLVNFPTE